SPAPSYNFAATPQVSSRDAFWEMKQSGKGIKYVHEAIKVPKNTGMGLIIAGFAFVMAFGLIWHIWWLAFIAFVAVIVCILKRTLSDEENEVELSVKELKRLDAKARKGIRV